MVFSSDSLALSMHVRSPCLLISLSLLVPSAVPLGVLPENPRNLGF